MRKFIFITMVMILGMSSVSFGQVSQSTNEKIYLCETDYHRKLVLMIPTKLQREILTDPDENLKNSDYMWSTQHPPNHKKFIVNTEGNDERIISVKINGGKTNLCLDGVMIQHTNKEWRYEGVGVSTKGGDFLSCRVPYLKKYGGHTMSEFVLDLTGGGYMLSRRQNVIQFSWYHNTNSGHSRHQMIGTQVGRCEEI